jgi:hypothetical protein
MEYRKLVFIIIFLAVSFNSSSQIFRFTSVNITEVIINGKSNIEKFDLHLIDKDNFHCKSAISIIDGKTLEFEIPVENIQSRKTYIEEDFKKIINEKEFPYIRLRIGSDQLNLLLKRNSEKLETSLTIAGRSNEYPIEIKEFQVNDTTCQIDGKIELFLSDYAIDPVSKLFGIIRVEDKVVINFKLNLQSNFADITQKGNFPLTSK